MLEVVSERVCGMAVNLGRVMASHSKQWGNGTQSLRRRLFAKPAMVLEASAQNQGG